MEIKSNLQVTKSIASTIYEYSLSLKKISILSLENLHGYSCTIKLGLIFRSLSFITEVFSFPIVLCSAIICLFRLVISTVSKSTIEISPIPALIRASAANPPTPPTPKTITWEFLSLFKFSLPIKSSVLWNIIKFINLILFTR